jgi:protein SCO1
MNKFFSLVVVIVIFQSCELNKKQLPFLGEKTTQKINRNGKVEVDTLYHTIPAYQFVDQNNDTVTNKNLQSKIYVADFFFVSCPTICPKMKGQMLRLFKHFKGNESVAFLSHTIDPKHDTVPVLNEFAKGLGVVGNQWRFVTGDKDKIYEVGLKGYMATAKEDSTADGGFIHSGAFILVDQKQRVRGIYDGTLADEVDKLQNDIELLLAEKNEK